MNNLLITEVYKDVVSPVAKQAGVTIGEVSKLIFSPIYLPIKALNNRIENWFKRIEHEVPEQNRVEAAPNISIPTLQGLALNQDESILGEMFYNILRNSVDKTQQKYLSPAFPKLLEQLTKDEAIMLLLLKDKFYQVEYFSEFDETQNRFINRKEVSNEFPVTKFTFPENLWMYNDHLNHLNLATCWEYKQSETVFSDEIFEIGTGAFRQTQKKPIGLKTFYKFRLTDFGKLFAQVCITDKCKKFMNK